MKPDMSAELYEAELENLFALVIRGTSIGLGLLVLCGVMMHGVTMHHFAEAPSDAFPVLHTSTEIKSFWDKKLPAYLGHQEEQQLPSKSLQNHATPERRLALLGSARSSKL